MTAAGTALGAAILKRAIVASQRIPRFAARGPYSYTLPRPVNAEFPQAETEYADSRGLAENFEGSSVELASAIGGMRVLDYGSGYGGRTVWYAERALAVHGVEVFQSMVEKSAAFARKMNVANCEFHLGGEDAIQFGDNTFDVVISADVLEHVKRPDLILPEMHRVLKPGGLALIVFTPYFGMFAHHLNYITLLPALHWIFSPHTVVGAVNELLSSHPSFAGLGVREQPLPQRSFNDKRLVLPSLNGMTKPEFLRLLRPLGFSVEFIRTTPILEKFDIAGRAGAMINRWICAFPVLDEAFGHNLVTVLRKR